VPLRERVPGLSSSRFAASKYEYLLKLYSVLHSKSP